jgi:spore coat protein U-like protein
MPLLKNRKKLISGVLCGALYCAIGAAFAQSCAASSAPVAFGNYNTFGGTVLDTAGTVTVTCSAPVSALVLYTIRLDGGTGGVIASRRMANGTSYLPYQLYTDAARTAIWGDGTGGTSTVTDGYLLAVATPVIKSFTVYGRIAANQNVRYGSYLDTVTILLTF